MEPTRDTNARGAALLAGLGLVFLFCLPLPGHSWYLGQFPPNLWHNGTIIAMMPFGVLLFLNAVEFLRRFLCHMLPKSFVRIRHYGFLANRCRGHKLQLCRRLLNTQAERQSTSDGTSSEHPAETYRSEEKSSPCPVCKEGKMILILTFARGESVPDVVLALGFHDTS